MNKIHQYLLPVSIAIILGGGLFLVWYYFIDGVYLNPVVTYRNGFDPENMPLSQESYQPGEYAAYVGSFCKNRPSNTTIQWALANRVLTIYPERPTATVAVGCYPEYGETIIVPIQMIPLNAEKGCNHYFVGTRSSDIGGGRVLTQRLKTQTFCVR